MSNGAMTAVQAATTAVASSAVTSVSRKRRASPPHQKKNARTHSVTIVIQLVR